MAYEYYVEFGRVLGQPLVGPVTIEGLRGGFEISGFDLTISRDARSAGGVVQPMITSDVTLHFANDAGLGRLLQSVSNGGAFETLSVTGLGFTGGEAKSELVRLDFSKAFITKVTDTDGPGFDVTFTYTGIEESNHNVGNAGNVTAAPNFTWDFVRADNGATIADVSNDTNLKGAVPELKYYLLLDGVKGDSTDAGHEGWFALDDFNLELAREVNLLGGGGAGGVGKVNFEPLTLSLGGDAALTALLQKVSLGTNYAGVRIEGVFKDNLSDTNKVAYSLDLGKVGVGSLTNTSNGVDAEFTFGAYKLQTSVWDGARLTAQTDASWDATRGVVDWTPPRIAPALGGGTATTPDKYFLVVSDPAFQGNALDKNFVGAFDVEDFRFQVDFVASPSGGGKPAVDDLTVYFDSKSGLRAFLDALTSGKALPTVSLIGGTSGGNTTSVLVESYRLNLGNVQVTAVNDTPGGDQYGYSVDLHFRAADLTTRQINGRGEQGAQTQFGFDYFTGTGGGNVPDATVQPGGSQVSASNFYLLVDGVNGGATEVGHEGWFKLEGFDLGASKLAALGGGGVGKTDLEPVTLTLGPGAYAALLSAVERGANLAGVRIEGSANLTDGRVVTYKADLVNVSVTSLTQSSIGDNPQGADVQISYTGLSLTTRGYTNQGVLQAPTTVTWNTLTNTTSVSVPNLRASTDLAKSAAAADNFYLVIPKVGGASTDVGHENSLSVSDFSISVENPVSNGGGASRSVPSDLIVHFDSQTGLDAFLNSMQAGGRLNTASLVGTTASNKEVYRLDLANATVTDIQADQDGYSVRLSYTALEMTTRGVAADGKLTAPTSVGYDFATQQAGVTVADAMAGEGVPDSHPSDFFVKFDGVNGPSADEAHVGWYDVQSFSFHSALSPSGGGAGRFEAGQVTIIMQGEGVSNLLLLMRSSTVLPNVELHGVQIDATGKSVTAYDLDLHGAQITSVRQVSGELGLSFEVTIAYDSVELSTSGKNIDTLSFPADTAPHTLMEIAGATGSTALDTIIAPLAFTETDLSASHTATLSAPTFGGTGASAMPSATATALANAATTIVNSSANGAGAGRVFVEFAAQDRLFDFLSAGQTLTVTYQVNLANDRADSHSQPVTFTITGANDPVSNGANVNVNLAEATGVTGSSSAITASRVVPFVDIDLGDTHTIALSAPQISLSTGTAPAGFADALAGALTATLTDSTGTGAGSTAITFSAQDKLFDFLANGQTATLTYTLSINDGHGSTGSQPITVTMKGANDAPAAATFAVQTISEAAATTGSSALTTASATLNFSDPDRIDSHTATVGAPTLTAAGGAVLPAGLASALTGALTLGPINESDGAGSLVASFAAADKTFDFLGVGQSVTISYDVTVKDAFGGQVVRPMTVVVNGANDAPTGAPTATLPGGAAGADYAVSKATLLAGFTDVDGDTLSVSGLTANHGTVSATADGFLIRPDAGYSGPVTLSYSVVDGRGGSVAASLGFTLTASNRAPTAVADTASVNEKAQVTIDVLANDTDLDAGDVKSLVSVSASAKGAGIAIVGGKVVYTANVDSFDLLTSGQSTTDSFTYVMKDAAGLTSSSSVTVTINGVANGATRTGTSGADTLTGTALDERLDGAAGNDSLVAGGGADTLVGGAGNDWLKGEAGIDSLSGGDGNDTLDGGAGDDVMSGGRGADRFVFTGRFGDDTVTDFKSGEDVIHFADAGFVNFADVIAHATQSGANVVITNSFGDSLQLNVTSLSSLKAADFLFG